MLLLFLYSHMRPEKLRGFVVALDGLRQADVHMEHMAHFLPFRRAIEPAGSGNTPFPEEGVHGLGLLPQEIIGGSGQEGGEEPGINGTQNIQPGICQVKAAAQIVIGKAPEGAGSKFRHIVKAAEKPHS